MAVGGGYSYGIMMPTMEMVGIGRGGLVEEFRGDGKGDRNRRHWDDHQ